MPVAWNKVRDYTDIIFEKAEGIGKITINRPEVRNAFRPETLTELIDAFNDCREDPRIGVVILTGAGDQAFCSGGDQRVRGHGGYVGSAVVPLERLEEETIQWAREILEKSPLALRFLKAAFNADTDGLAGIQELAGDATMLYYMTEEGQEGKNAFLEKRKPDFSRFPRLP